MPGSLDALHRGERRHSHLDAATGSVGGKRAETQPHRGGQLSPIRFGRVSGQPGRNLGDGGTQLCWIDGPGC